MDVNGELKFLQKLKKRFRGVGGGSGGGVRWGVGLVGGQGGCERRIEVFVNIQKKNWGGGEGGNAGGDWVGWGVGFGGSG